MKFSNETKLKLFLLLIILNLILRCHPAHHEIGSDSVEMHILANSISTFGEARWWVHPLSVIGMFPNSYAGAISFIVSGISQCSDVDVESVTFIYGIIFGIFSIFTSYLVAGVLYDDDFFKFLVAFGFSTSQGILTYTTWTMNARSPFIVILPLFLYLLWNSRKHHLRFGSIIVIITLLLLATHHLFFYLIPVFFAYFAVVLVYKLKKYTNLINISDRLMPLLLIVIFCLMLAYPFITHKFMTVGSRWSILPLMLHEYPRYIGMFVFFLPGGFLYILFKSDKRFEEWSLLTALIFLCVFMFEERYMKWFIIIFAILLAGMGLMNLKQFYENKRKHAIITTIAMFLLLSICFSGYLQFLHDYRETPIYKRYIDNPTYETSFWIKENMAGRCICNNYVGGWKLTAISGLPFLTGSYTSDQAYGFVDVSEYELVKRPITSEKFWMSSPYAVIEDMDPDGYWHVIMDRRYDTNWASTLLHRFNISYLVEHTPTDGRFYSRHGYRFSEFVGSVSNEKNCIYDCGTFNIWMLSQD